MSAGSPVSASSSGEGRKVATISTKQADCVQHAKASRRIVRARTCNTGLEPGARPSYCVSSKIKMSAWSTGRPAARFMHNIASRDAISTGRPSSSIGVALEARSE